MLVRVVEPVRRIVTVMSTITDADEGATRQAAEGAEEYLARVKRELEQAGRPVQVEVKVSATGLADEILGTARDRDADLIVMATHGRGGPGRWLLGSVADAVVRHADRPVLLVSARALAARALGAWTVGDVMTRDVATLREDEPLSVALYKLLRRRVSGAPVVDADGNLVGVLSEQDLLGWQTHLAETLASHAVPVAAEYGRRLGRDTVGRLMSRPPVTIEQSAPLSAAIRLFQERKFRRLPVLHEGRLVGILARADVLWAMAAHSGATVDPTDPGDATAAAPPRSG
jgi:CBS domain-containing protein